MSVHINYVIMYIFQQNELKKTKKNLLWFYLRSPDILLQEVSCNIIKGEKEKKIIEENFLIY